MEGKSSYFILLIIVAFLSITLAFLAIGFFFFGNGGSAPDEKVVSEATQEIPRDEDLAKKVIIENKNFNLKKTNDKEIAVIVINASLKYYKEVDKLKEEDISAKIDFYSNEINSEIGTYFQGLTLEDVRKIEMKQKAAEDLTKKINEILSGGEQDASPLVYSMTFDYWFYQ